MDEESLLILQNEIAKLEQDLANKKRQLEVAQTALEKQTVDTMATQEPLSLDSSKTSLPKINRNSSPEEKIVLFRSLFKGREDVYAVLD